MEIWLKTLVTIIMKILLYLLLKYPECYSLLHPIILEKFNFDLPKIY